MRINHNIAAMNSYRNFSANSSKLSKNLEKLSTGMRINRAGDDAAGLAISEKMRAQISGIDGATKNAKDGISLIQTAEGALTEVHDMLNRMVTLAEQSANGTYDDETDRDQLQKEVEQLKSEIDRIADSTNYNGIKLLDGSLSGGGSLDGNVKLNSSESVAARVTTSALTAFTQGHKDDKVSMTLTWTDANGKDQKATISFHYNEAKNALVSDYDGTQYATSSNTTTVSQLESAFLGELQKNQGLNEAFDMATSASGIFRFTSKVSGTKGAVLNSIDTKTVSATNDNVGNVGAQTITPVSQPFDQVQKLDFANIRVLGKTMLENSGDIEKAVKENTFTIDGHKVAFIGANCDFDDVKTYIDDDTHVIKLTQNAATSTTATGFSISANANDSKLVAAELTRLTGRDFGVAAAAGNGLLANDIILKGGDTVSKAGKSLDLQIGDTSDSFNKLSVSVKDMHVASLGLANVDISSQSGAQKAMDIIKGAVNEVSDTRGTMGSLQNRLDHTINNLGVMKENITSSESLIRDTDVAEEMMAYTKNNILNQAAQAMLAQANQLPQGVLQLLG